MLREREREIERERESSDPLETILLSMTLYLDVLHQNR